MKGGMNLLRLIGQWQRDGVELLPPCAETSVIQRLSSLNRLLSRDVVELYCTTGGMVDGGMDEACWSLWPLARVVAENTKRSPDLLLFADFLLDSHAYGLRWENNEISSVHVDYGVGEPQRVADSLDQFFQLYLTDPHRIGL
jgi:hypothetical protein